MNNKILYVVIISILTLILSNSKSINANKIITISSPKLSESTNIKIFNDHRIVAEGEISAFDIRDYLIKNNKNFNIISESQQKIIFTVPLNIRQYFYTENSKSYINKLAQNIIKLNCHQKIYINNYKSGQDKNISPINILEIINGIKADIAEEVVNIIPKLIFTSNKVKKEPLSNGVPLDKVPHNAQLPQNTSKIHSPEIRKKYNIFNRF